DGAYTLEMARANVARFNWMYDPSNLPEWLSRAPDAAELQARADLNAVYRAIDDEPAGDRFLELWEIARGAEDDLRARAAPPKAADVEAAEADAGIVDASEDAA